MVATGVVYDICGENSQRVWSCTIVVAHEQPIRVAATARKPFLAWAPDLRTSYSCRARMWMLNFLMTRPRLPPTNRASSRSGIASSESHNLCRDLYRLHPRGPLAVQSRMSPARSGSLSKACEGRCCFAQGSEASNDRPRCLSIMWSKGHPVPNKSRALFPPRAIPRRVQPLCVLRLRVL